MRLFENKFFRFKLCDKFPRDLTTLVKASLVIHFPSAIDFAAHLIKSLSFNLIVSFPSHHLEINDNFICVVRHEYLSRNSKMSGDRSAFNEKSTFEAIMRF